MLFLSSPTYAQYRETLKEETFNPANFEKFVIKIEKKKKDYPWVVDFKSVSFVDLRPDTSKLGFVIAGENPVYRNVVFPKPTAEYLNEKINEFYSPNPESLTEITFFLKQIWISERLIKTEPGKNILKGPIEYLSYFYFNADCYKVSDNKYTYLGTLDTITSQKKWIVNAADDLLKQMLFEALDKANKLYKNANSEASFISLSEIIKKHEESANFPILKAEEPEQGIYITYSDFLNNSPTIREFEVLKNKSKKYLKASNIEDTLLSNAWGFYDGKNLNIHVNDSYYKAIRSQNTFELAGPRNTTKIYSTGGMIFASALTSLFSGLASGGFSILMMGSTNQIMKELVPYQLNMKDGTLY